MQREKANMTGPYSDVTYRAFGKISQRPGKLAASPGSIQHEFHDLRSVHLAAVDHCLVSNEFRRPLLDPIGQRLPEFSTATQVMMPIVRIFVDRRFPVVRFQRPIRSVACWKIPMGMSNVEEGAHGRNPVGFGETDATGPAAAAFFVASPGSDDLDGDFLSRIFGYAATELTVEVFLSHLQACRDDFDLVCWDIWGDVIVDIAWTRGQFISGRGGRRRNGGLRCGRRRGFRRWRWCRSGCRRGRGLRRWRWCRSGCRRGRGLRRRR